MTDEEETAEKASKRDRFKSALSRTRTKLRKKDTDQSSNDVEEFLATARDSTSTGRPSISDSLNFADSISAHPNQPPTSDSSTNIQSKRVPVPGSLAPPPQQSPRRIVVPRIDVSASQRYPGAQGVGAHKEQGRNEFLKPQHHGRSQSVSSLSKGRGRARGMSVTFTEASPIVIGEGGDEAEAPTIEVSHAKRRARSVSPTPTPRAAGPIGRLWSRSPIHRKPVPEKIVSPVKEEDDFFSPGVRRVQTGLPTPALQSKRATKQEFEMSLGLSSASTMSPDSTTSPQQPPLHAPRPVRPPVPVPSAREPPLLKSTHGTKNLRSKYERHEPASQTPPVDQSDSGPNRRFYQNQAHQAHQPRQLPWRQLPEQRGRTGPGPKTIDSQGLPNDNDESWL